MVGGGQLKVERQHVLACLLGQQQRVYNMAASPVEQALGWRRLLIMLEVLF